eukprot:2163183-Lingulodinium_polyedra.AAC.1
MLSSGITQQLGDMTIETPCRSDSLGIQVVLPHANAHADVLQSASVCLSYFRLAGHVEKRKTPLR